MFDSFSEDTWKVTDAKVFSCLLITAPRRLLPVLLLDVSTQNLNIYNAVLSQYVADLFLVCNTLFVLQDSKTVMLVCWILTFQIILRAIKCTHNLQNKQKAINKLVMLKTNCSNLAYLKLALRKFNIANIIQNLLFIIYMKYFL